MIRLLVFGFSISVFACGSPEVSSETTAVLEESSLNPTERAADSTAQREALFALDWAQLKKYHADNERLLNEPVDAKNPRVVFMGNSITEGWAYQYPELFERHSNWINRGISGQTTPQMLVRFRPDVLALKPAKVVFLAGINDIAANTGLMTLEETFGNIVSMAQLAEANGIKVVICSVLPAYDFPWRPGMEPAQKVVKLNAMLQAYAKTAGHEYLDFFSAMADDRPGLRAGLHSDEVHPTKEGYAIMAELLEQQLGE